MAPKIHVRKTQESNQHLRLAFSLLEDTSCKDPNNRTATTTEYAVGDFAQVRFKVMFKDGTNYFYFSCAFKIHNLQKDSNIQINATCNFNGKANNLICPLVWSEFIDIGRVPYQLKSGTCFTFSAIIDIIVNSSIRSPWTILHNDDSFADFHLSSENGSVPVHRVVMAAHSDVFKTMLSGEWKETAEGCLQVKGVTQQTLQHLKDYMYLGSVPEQHEDLRPLLLIAKCYMMQRLEEACSDKLTQNATPETFQGILEFAVYNRLFALISSIFRNTPVNVVEAAEVLNKEPKLKAAEE